MSGTTTFGSDSPLSAVASGGFFRRIQPGQSNAPTASDAAKPAGAALVEFGMMSANATVRDAATTAFEKIDPKVTTVYKGKVIGFCCEDCIEKFNKDPEKYMKTLK